MMDDDYYCYFLKVWKNFYFNSLAEAVHQKKNLSWTKAESQQFINEVKSWWCRSNNSILCKAENFCSPEPFILSKNSDQKGAQY